eukprot:scaffold117312_cov39-Phaeocystis_antarctica.AAC.1
MSSRYASSKPPQMYKCRYAYLRYYLSHIVASCEISESAVAYLVLPIGTYLCISALRRFVLMLY